MNAVKSANYAKDKARQLQTALYLAAKGNPRRRFHALYDKVHCGDILWEAWKRVKANGGSGGGDGMTINHIVKAVGEERFVGEIQKMLMEGEYHPLPARRREKPKADGKMRPLGIPAIRDRVVQMATKMVVEPIFEADFKDCSYGFRPSRNQHGAIRHIRRAVKKGAMKGMRQKVKEATEPRNRLFWTMNKVTEELNPKIQGGKNDYGLDSFADLFLNKIGWYIRKRLTLFWNKKHNRRNKHSKSRQLAMTAQLAGLKKLVS